MPDNRNFLIAIVLSLAVLIGWQFFFVGPEIDRLQQQQAVDQAQQAAGDDRTTGAAGAVGELPGASAAPGTLTVDAALSQSRRIAIETPSLSGSLNLTGARIDDLHLSQFRETVEPASPTITLLSPSGAPNAYFAEFGWIGTGAGDLPGPQTQWNAPEGAKLTPESPVTLTYDNGAGLLFTRTITVDDKYLFAFTDKVENKTTGAVELSPFGRITRIGDPVVAGYWILHEGMIGVFGEEGLREEGYSGIRDAGQQSFSDVTQGWLGMTDKYWATAIIPDQQKPFTGRFLHEGANASIYQADFRGQPKNIAAGASVSETNRLFAGAKQVAVIDGYRDTYEIKLFDRIIDWGWFWFFTKPLFYLMDWFYRLFGNFGVAILAVTVVVKIFFFPLANRSYKSMSAMKKVQPAMMELREKYKDDKVKQQQALMELYKKEKINPLAGCWPMLVQIPVFFALYKVLFVTIEMRHAPFFGWIRDLAAPDPTHLFNLFGLLPYDPSAVPVIGAFLAIGIWPIIMGITMFVQMRLNPTPPDPAQAMIFTWMPVLFTFMLASFPAGLVIYWAWNNTLSIMQQWYIMRRYGTEVNLWNNILESLGIRKPKPATAAASAVAIPAPANDDGRPSGKRKKPKGEKGKS